VLKMAGFLKITLWQRRSEQPSGAVPVAHQQVLRLLIGAERHLMGLAPYAGLFVTAERGVCAG
jgi:hypothetical protein